MPRQANKEKKGVRATFKRDRKRIAWRFGTAEDLRTLTEEEYEMIRERKR